MKLFWLVALVGCVPGGQGNHMTQPRPPNPNATVSGVAWCGTQFVAVAALGGTGGIVITSRDGIVWTAKALGTFGLRGVASAGSPSAAVAVGAAGTIVSSPDGVAWTTQTSGTSVDLNWVAWSGTEFVAVGSAGTILTSPDGVTWTARTSGTTLGLSGVASSGTEFVAVGDSGAVLTSPDGVTWTAQSSGVPNYRRIDVKWSGTQWISVGQHGTILTSPDGVTWTARASGTLNAMIGVAWQTTASWPWEGSGRSSPRPMAFSGRARW